MTKRYWKITLEDAVGSKPWDLVQSYSRLLS